MKSLTFLAILLFLVGCNDDKKSAPAAQAQAAQMPPLQVKAHEIKFDKANFTKSYSAVLKPFKEVEVVARVKGVLVKENFKEGTFVKEGAVLYEIQKDEYSAALEESKASLLKAEANYNKALKDWERTEFLFKNKAVSQQQRDDILYAYDSAKAEVQKAKAALKNAELNYGYTTIKAPIDGIVGLSSRDVGAYIETQNSKLTIVTALDSVYAEFSVPSSDASKYISQIKAGAKVTLSRGIKTYDGEVDFIAPKLDSQTDTLLLRAKFKNSDRDLIIGSYVEISLGGFSYESVAKIPQIALVKTSDATMVYIIENGAISMRPVKVSHVEDGMAFIGDGLKDGEHIAISNMAKLKPNSKVTVGDGK